MFKSVLANLHLANFQPQEKAKTTVFGGVNIDSNNGVDLPNVPGFTFAKQAEASQNPQFYKGTPGTLALKENIAFNISEQFNYVFPPHSVTCLELYQRR